jgi:hypothetical protein
MNPNRNASFACHANLATITANEATIVAAITTIMAMIAHRAVSRKNLFHVIIGLLISYPLFIDVKTAWIEFTIYR